MVTKYPTIILIVYSKILSENRIFLSDKFRIQDSDGILLCLRLPDGHRLQHKFVMTHKIQVLF